MVYKYKKGKTTALVLRKAENVIEKGWTQGVTAQDASGRATYPQNPDARRWCAFGALWLVGDTSYDDAAIALRAVLGVKIHAWNDRIAESADEVILTMELAAHLAERGELP